MLRSSFQQGSPSSWLAVVFTTILVIVFIVAISRRRGFGRRTCSRQAQSRFASAGCANPTHGALKSSDKAELRAVRRSVLCVIRGDTSKRQKICVDCIAKLSRKPEFRHVFKVYAYDIQANVQARSESFVWLLKGK